MTPNAEVSQIAQRVLRAFEDPTRGSLHSELDRAEHFVSFNRIHERDRASEEERSELLGAIAQEMRLALERGAGGNTLHPHRQLLHHLSRPGRRIN